MESLHGAYYRDYITLNPFQLFLNNPVEKHSIYKVLSDLHLFLQVLLKLILELSRLTKSTLDPHILLFCKVAFHR